MALEGQAPIVMGPLLNGSLRCPWSMGRWMTEVIVREDGWRDDSPTKWMAVDMDVLCGPIEEA